MLVVYCMSSSYMSICMTTWPSSVKRSLEVLEGTSINVSRYWRHRNFPPPSNAPLHGDHPSLPLCMSCEAESGPQRRPTPHVRRESGSWRSIRQCDYQLNCEEYNPRNIKHHKTNISNWCFLGKPNKFLEWEWLIFGNSRTINHGHRASLQCWNSMIFVNVCKSAMCKTQLNCPLPVFHWQRSPG